LLYETIIYRSWRSWRLERLERSSAFMAFKCSSVQKRKERTTPAFNFGFGIADFGLEERKGENHPVSRSGCHPSFVRRGALRSSKKAARINRTAFYY
jgi:hypothetical protein